MRKAIFQAVRQQYGFCCGYCGTTETDAGTTLTVDHYQPRSQGGSDDFANLVYCCHACNEHKGNYWNPNAADRILHPIRDVLTTHYAEQTDFTLLGFTDEGCFHIARLQLNRPALVNQRRTKQDEQDKRREQREMTAVFQELLRYVTEIKQSVDEIRSGGE